MRAEVLTVATEPLQDPRVASAIANAIMSGIKSISKDSASGKHRAFNNTGTLANGISVQGNGMGYDIVAPVGYLENDVTMQKLIDLVPAIDDPMSAPEVEAAILSALDDAFLLR